MDGEKFISNLKRLGVPDLDKVDPSSYDWIFLDPDASELSSFWQRFFSKNSLATKLTDEELRE